MKASGRIDPKGLGHIYIYMYTYIHMYYMSDASEEARENIRFRGITWSMIGAIASSNNSTCVRRKMQNRDCGIWPPAPPPPAIAPPPCALSFASLSSCSVTVPKSIEALSYSSRACQALRHDAEIAEAGVLWPTRSLSKALWQTEAFTASFGTSESLLKSWLDKNN